jgi:NADPH-dependent glutamate synthase beta subunit-like oxidoreductase
VGPASRPNLGTLVLQRLPPAGGAADEIAPRFVARSQLLESLGVEVVEQALGVGWRVASDATGQTNVPGVWVAGNVTDLAAQVIVAAAAGTAAAAQINADLVAEDLRQATATAR